MNSRTVYVQFSAATVITVRADFCRITVISCRAIKPYGLIPELSNDFKGLASANFYTQLRICLRGKLSNDSA